MIDQNKQAKAAPSDAAAAAAEIEELTPEAGDVERAAKAVAHLFSLMGIKRVVSVDDSYEGTFEDFVSLAVVASGAGIRLFAGNFDLSDEEEVWRTSIHDAWEEADEDTKRLWMSEAMRETGSRDDDEPHLDASHLSPLLQPSGVEFDAVSHVDWPKMLKEVVSSADLKPTLVLFDQEMGGEEELGLKFAEKLFREDVHGKTYVALLTRKVEKGEEHSHWRAVTEKFTKIPSNRFVVISKSHLGPNPESFPGAIRTVLSTRPAAHLRAAVSKVVEDAAKVAKDELDKLPPDDFQGMIVRSSMSEGVWEPESLLRVLQILMRGHIRKELYGLDIVKDGAAEMRALWSVDEVWPPPSEQAVRVAAADFYDFADTINTVHLPLELGDVFQSGDKRYVLAEQPCDLMVRSNGSRQPEIYDVTLLPVIQTGRSSASHLFELPYFLGARESRWVSLNRPALVPVRVLDLTVFNREGAAALSMADEPPPNLWPAWSARYHKVRGKLSTLCSHQAELDALLDSRALKKVTHKQLSERLIHVDSASGREISGTINGQTVTFNISRVGRLQGSLARSMLLQYAFFKARDARDFPLAQSR